LMASVLQAHVGDGGSALVVAHHDLTLGCNTRRLELTA
jgi:hypothetical protein